MRIVADDEIMIKTDLVMDWLDAHPVYSKKPEIEKALGMYMLIEFLLDQDGYTSFRGEG